MPEQNSTAQPAPPNFLLDVIILEVNCAQQTHRFLSDVFAQLDPPGSSPNENKQPPQGSLLSPDGKHAMFSTVNARIQFSTAKSSGHSAGEGSLVGLGVLVKDIDNVKKALDKHHVAYTHGRWEELPGRPRWIEFRDSDGYIWKVSEFMNN